MKTKFNHAWAKLMTIMFSVFFLLLNCPHLLSQQPLIIDHTCTSLRKVPFEWINSATTNLHIGYGHTSHGSQIISGMEAISSFYPDGPYQFSNSGNEGTLHLFEGCGYCDDGELIYDLSYEEQWYPSVKQYLQNHSDCNVIMYSWCNIYGHGIDYYLQRMDSLVDKYGPGGTDPGADVYFVYMTGHANMGDNCEWTHNANQKIRDHCKTKNRILFDFNDIESWNPEGEYFGDGDTEGIYTGEHQLKDDISYNLAGGGRGNWGIEWLAANEQDTLTLINNLCTDCAHSDNSRLHCVLKGMATWWMFARLAGWDGADGGEIPTNKPESDVTANAVSVWPNPAGQFLSVNGMNHEKTTITFMTTDGRIVKTLITREKDIDIPIADLARGWYFVRAGNASQMKVEKVLLK